MRNDASHQDRALRKTATTEIEQFLQVGMQVLFECVTSHGSTRRHPARLVGWKHGRLLILDIVFKEGQRSATLANGRGALRFMHRGQPCAMRVHSLETRIEGARSLFTVSWPEHVVYVKLRADERHDVRVPLDARLADGTHVPGQLRNLSLGGARIYLPVQVRQGDTAVVAFRLPNGTECRDIELGLRHVEAAEPGDGCECGCSFEGIGETVRNSIQFYLAVRAQGGGHAEDRARSILIVDEAPQLLERAAAHLLRSRGFEPVFVRDVVQAFTWLGIAQPCAVAINAGLRCVAPGTLCSLIRGSAAGSALPIVLYGGEAAPDAARLRATGADAYLPGIDGAAGVAALARLVPAAADAATGPGQP